MENSVLEHIKNTYSKFLIDGNSILHVISALGFSDLLKELLKYSYDIDSQNDLGWTPLMQAARYGHIECILILLKANANIFCRNFYGLDARVIASASGNLDCVKILERFCEKIDTIDTVIGSVSVAVLFQNYEILKFLLQTYPLRANETTDIGLTPLMFAAASNDKDAIQILYSFNANKDLKNIRNKTAEDILHKQFDQVLVRSGRTADIWENSNIEDSETLQIYNHYKNKLEQSIIANMSRLAVVKDKIRLLSHSSDILSPVKSPDISPIFIEGCSSIKCKKSSDLEDFNDNEEQFFFPKHFSNGAEESMYSKYFQNVSAILNRSFREDSSHLQCDFDDDVFYNGNEESAKDFRNLSRKGSANNMLTIEDSERKSKNNSSSSDFEKQNTIYTNSVPQLVDFKETDFLTEGIHSDSINNMARGADVILMNEMQNSRFNYRVKNINFQNECAILPDNKKKYEKIIGALRRTNLQKYIPLFLKEEIDSAVFITLTNEDLLTLGILSEKDRNVILKIQHDN